MTSRLLRTSGLLLLGALPLLLIGWRASTYVPGGDVDDAFTITDMQVAAILDASGSLSVRERITARFHTPRHGIFRDLPVAGPAGELDYTIGEIQQDGSAAQVVQGDIEDGVRLRIGDPDVTIVGEHRYTIDYTIDRLLAAVPDRGIELRWDTFGYGWPTDVGHASVSLRLPEEPRAVGCVAGPVGSTEACAAPRGDATDGIVWTFDELGPFRGATVSTVLPPSAFSTSPPRVDLVPLGEDAGPTRWLSARFLFPGAITGLALLITIWPLRRWRQLRELAGLADAAPTVFRPPAGKPETHATLVDPSPDPGDLRAATLIRLATDGAIRIDPERSDDAALVVARGDTAGLDRFDRQLVETLTPADGSFREWSASTPADERTELSRSFAEMDWDERTGVRAGLSTFGASKAVWFAVLFGSFFAVIGAMAAGVSHITSNGVPTSSPTSIGLFSAAFAGIGALVVNVGTGARLRARWHAHLVGADPGVRRRWQQALGLRRAIEAVEEDRLDWAADQPGLDLQHAALELLPWAVAFGMGDAWLDRFGQVIQEQAAAEGVHVPRATHLASMPTVIAAASASPGSSGGGSGFGGGGGGSGGGGGGGGSW